MFDDIFEIFKAVKIFEDAYPEVYQTLYQTKPITCSVTGTTFDALPVPCAAIVDVSLLFCTLDSDTNSSLIVPLLSDL